MRIAILGIACCVAASQAFAFQPTGSIEELYRLDLLPRLRPGVKLRMFSSYDRKGGNDDGFNGTYSKLRLEDGGSVIAEMEGAGCIQRIWFTHSQGREPSLLGSKGEHIRVYIDGKDEPVIDVRLADLFAGKVERFPEPFVGGALGGFFCFVPIPYRDGCKVVVDGDDVHFYQLSYSEFPSDDGVASFSMELSAEQEVAMEKAVEVWSSPGDYSLLDVRKDKKTTKKLKFKKSMVETFELPKGPRMVRAIRLDGAPEELLKAKDARIRICWDGAEASGIDLRLEYFFCQAFDPEPFQSLLAGVDKKRWYSFIPMPYRSGATVEIEAAEPFEAKLRAMTAPIKGAVEDMGYLHAIEHEALPVEKGRYYPFLFGKGRGHYVGTLFATEGTKGYMGWPGWLEGDEHFIMDGELRAHGTGSEDYFNSGYYAIEGRLDGPGALPIHGWPVYKHGDDGPVETRAVAYRWHIMDVHPFEESIYFRIEHGGHNEVIANYRSASFFYTDSPAWEKQAPPDGADEWRIPGIAVYKPPKKTPASIEELKKIKKARQALRERQQAK